MKPVFIYALRDPRNSQIRYIGKTIQNPRDRLAAHIRQAKRENKSHRDRWILQVLADGKKPTYEIVEEATDDNWEDREKYWISCYDNLTNETNGGEGLHGHKFSKSHKQKLSQALQGNTRWLGKKHTNKTKAKMSKSMQGENNPNYGKTFSKEYRKKLSNSHKGTKRTEETRKKISERAKGNQNAKGHKQSPEHIAKLVESRKRTILEKQKKAVD